LITGMAAAGLGWAPASPGKARVSGAHLQATRRGQGAARAVYWLYAQLMASVRPDDRRELRNDTLAHPPSQDL
jgi:hypothetical protein